MKKLIDHRGLTSSFPTKLCFENRKAPLTNSSRTLIAPYKSPLDGH
ncbi:hypothetical protein [uncultured Croceitalea sp.]